MKRRSSGRVRAGEREAGNGFPPPFDRDQGIPAPYQSSDDDLAHLERFPQGRKAELLQQIRVLKPHENATLFGDNDFGHSILRLRRARFGLIDLQCHDTAFCTVWHRQRLTLLGGLHSEVAMLNWEFQDTGATTTFAVWRL